MGYVTGKSPGFKALKNIISSSWKCEASLAIHESGWLVYRFNNIDDKLAVLANGPYLIYGRPLILKLCQNTSILGGKKCHVFLYR